MCGHREARRHLRAGRIRILRCDRCALQYLDPRDRPRPDEVYGDEYFPTAAPSIAALKEAFYESILDGAERRAVVAGGRRLLDVGCGLGHSVRAGLRRGYRATGIDLNPAGLRRAPRGTVAIGSFRHLPFRDASFDLVTAIDVIEHSPDPVELLREMRRLLAPWGTAAVLTPDAGSPAARLLGAWWPHVIAEHWIYLDGRTLAAAAREAGFELVASRPMARTTSVGYVRSIGLRPHTTRVRRWIGRALCWVPERWAGRIIRVPTGDLLAVLRRPERD